MKGRVEYFPIVVGTGQIMILLRAALSAYGNVLFICPRTMHRSRIAELKKHMPEKQPPFFVTPQQVAKYGVPPGVELCLLDAGYPRHPDSRFWRAIFNSDARVWARDF